MILENYFLNQNESEGKQPILLDLYVPSHSVAFEIKEDFVESKLLYFQNEQKRAACKDREINLITVFPSTDLTVKALMSLIQQQNNNFTPSKGY